MADIDQIVKLCGDSQECFSAMWAKIPFIERFWFMIEPQLINLFQASAALTMLILCEIVGARIFKIDLIKAVDRVEKNPLAFSLLITGHFYAACEVVAAAWSI